MSAKHFVSFLILIGLLSFLSSCAVRTQAVEKPVKVEVPVKCEVPEVAKPRYITPSQADSSVRLLEILMHNYGECRVYSERLEKALEVCR